MRNLTYTISSLSDDLNGIFQDQTTSGSGDLTLNGALVSDGVATADEAQPVSLEGTGDNSGVTFTITGTDQDGAQVSVTLSGPNGNTVTTNEYLKTVSNVSVDGALTGDVEGGWESSNGGVSKTLRVNSKQPFSAFGLGIYVDLTNSPTMTYSAEYAYEQPEDSYTNSYAVDADWRSVDGLSGQTTSEESNIAYPVNAIRLKISSYTSGTAKLTVTQAY